MNEDLKDIANKCILVSPADGLHRDISTALVAEKVFNIPIVLNANVPPGTVYIMNREEMDTIGEQITRELSKFVPRELLEISFDHMPERPVLDISKLHWEKYLSPLHHAWDELTKPARKYYPKKHKCIIRMRRKRK